MTDTFMKKSLDAGCNKSPLNKNQINEGFENIHIKLIGYPSDEGMLRQCIAKQVLSTAGVDVGKDLDPQIAEELFRGGLQTGLEAFSFIFEISGISRQLTHELVRTRKAVFHQQSFRWTDLGDQFNVRMPQTIAGNLEAKKVYTDLVDHARRAYSRLKEMDIPYQDVRCVCPIGTETYIICSYPISEFLATYAYRACSMFLPEMQYAFKTMRTKVLERFPWMEPYIKISCERTKRCQFQGWESTEQCEFPWKSDRVYKPNLELIGLKGKAYGAEPKKG